ncbi:pirin family protein [Flaviflexus massiliensis]|uniref:pirin family protein n=1 Tax=Flaviflexus massiliensis TaxID=1522309 RepID=UPI001C9C4708|nr:pirin family protein [Flaviflexus massiliensis]
MPQRRRSLIGPWCFFDHYGPDNVGETGGMLVPRHPHTGLATVTLLFEGSIEHIDSTGFTNVVQPSEVNLMIAGSGVSHSEFSTSDTGILHGVQLWYALPDRVRNSPAVSQHYVAEPVTVPGGTVLTYIGSLAGTTSTVDTWVDSLAAQILINPGETVTVDVDESFEHGVLLDTGDLTIHAGDHSQGLDKDDLAYIPRGSRRLSFSATTPTRIMLIGGCPFEEKIVMWWNFVGPSHDEIVQYRTSWQNEIDESDAEAMVPELENGIYFDGVPEPRFETFPDNKPAPFPAPTLPNVRIKPRETP